MLRPGTAASLSRWAPEPRADSFGPLIISLLPVSQQLGEAAGGRVRRHRDQRHDEGPCYPLGAHPGDKPTSEQAANTCCEGEHDNRQTVQLDALPLGEVSFPKSPRYVNDRPPEHVVTSNPPADEHRRLLRSRRLRQRR